MDSKPSRPGWDEYFMKLAWLVAERATCLRHHVGAVVVKDKRILTTGYNGSVVGSQDCLALGCLRNKLQIPSGQRQEICRAVHAEQNAIIQGGYTGVDIRGSTLYCTHSPCSLCARMIVNAGIRKILTDVEYPDLSYKDIFGGVGIEFAVLKVKNFLIAPLL
ncbi:MAG: dCMP deaminase family protein [Elusimicrobiota bacterium]|nr:dCMP deaminase family protein [Elusimicrobiota bacterium]